MLSRGRPDLDGVTPSPRSSGRRIVAGTDGSSHGDHAAEVAAEIAAAADAELFVVRVIRAGEAAPSTVGRWSVPRRSEVASAAIDDRVRVEVLVGHPSIEIVRSAERLDASLLIIGRRPSVDIEGMVLGPTADEVVRRASIPCLVIRGGAWRIHPRILAAVDGTERGSAVLSGAARVAELCGGTIRAVTVFAGPLSGGAASLADPEVGERIRRIDALRKDRGRRRVDGVLGPPVLVRHGDPAEEVLAEASEGIDVIAVGIHRLGRPDSHLERGIARRVLRRASGAVLTIPL